MKKVQYKLVRMLLLSSTFPILVIGLLSVFSLEKLTENDARQRIRNGIEISTTIYNNLYDHLRYIVRDTNRRIFSSLESGQTAQLKEFIADFTASNHIDFFFVTDASGRILLCIGNQNIEGSNVGDDPYVSDALKGKAFVGTEVIDEIALSRLGLLRMAAVPGVGATRGLVIKASLPVINSNEVVVGSMTAGYIINNNKSIILEQIFNSTGMVSSIFLEGRRICTTVPADKQGQVLGTSFYDTPYNIPKEGYHGKIKLAGNWYISGYTPIRNREGKVAAMLGIGIPAGNKGIFALREELVVSFILAMVISIILSMGMGMFLGRGIVVAINKLKQGIEAFGRGNLNFRVKINSGDELEGLAGFFNKTLEQLVTTGQEKSSLGYLLEAYMAMSSMLSLEALSQCVSEYACRLTGAEKTSLMLLDEATSELVLKSQCGLKPEAVGCRVKMGKNISGIVAEKGEAVCVDDITKHPQFKLLMRQDRYESNSFISLPLKRDNKVIGVLNVSDKAEGPANFSEEDMRYLQLLANQAILQIENIRLYDRLSSFAVTDALTGLYNHRYFHEQLGLEMLRSQRHHFPLSLIMFDVDSFKEYNDTYGHLMGDEVLKSVSAKIRRCIRRTDIVCRYAGDEFVIILPHTILKDAVFVAEKVAKEVNRTVIEDKQTGNTLSITLSGGVSSYHDGVNKDNFLARADEALYKAKSEGKNRVASL